MNIQQLRYLVAAADTGSVSGAARSERVSQPVVSRALRTFEREQGVRLFRRDGRCLAFTEAGVTVVAAARRALAAIDDVTAQARRLAVRAELAVVATPTNSALLSSIVTSFVRHHPGIALRLRRANSMAEVAAMVLAGEAEIGFGDIPEDLAEVLRAQPLWSVDVALVSPIGTDLPDAVPPGLLREAQLILPPDGSERRRMIDERITGGPAGTRPPALATDERSAWLSSAQQGLGSYLSYLAVACDLDGVEIRPFDPPIVVEVGFLQRSDGVSDQGTEMMRLALGCPPPAGCRPSRERRVASADGR